MREIWRDQLWIVLVAAVVIMTNLGATRLWDDDEPRNAGCAAEMQQRGDWLVPTFNGHLRTDKPVLLYWFTMLAYGLWGVSEWSARLTSALCGIGTILLTYHLGRRLFGAAAGRWAALLLCGSLMFGVASRAATPDSLLIFCSTLSICIFVLGGSAGSAAASADSNDPTSSPIVGLPTRWWVYCATYAAMSLAVLAKGPVGIVLPTAVLGLYLLLINTAEQTTSAATTSRGLGARIAAFGAWLWRVFSPARIGRFAWQLRPLTALGVLAVVALPWYVAVGIATGGDWPAGFLWRHNVERFAAPMEGHSGPPFYHLLSIAVGFFPASVFLAPMGIHTVRRLQNNDPQRRGYLLALSWIAVYLVVFSIAGTKLPSYVTPTHPALALLTGALLQSWIAARQEVSRRWQFAALGVYTFVGFGFLLAMVIVCGGFIERLGLLDHFNAETRAEVEVVLGYLRGHWSLVLLGAIPLLGGIVCLTLAARNRPLASARVFVVSAAAFCMTLLGWQVLHVDRHQESARLADAIQTAAGSDARVASFKVFRSSWSFYARRPIGQFGEPSEAAASLQQGDHDVLVLEESRLGQLQPFLAADVREVGRVPRFLEPGYLILLRRETDHTAKSRPTADAATR